MKIIDIVHRYIISQQSFVQQNRSLLTASCIHAGVQKPSGWHADVPRGKTDYFLSSCYLSFKEFSLQETRCGSGILLLLRKHTVISGVCADPDRCRVRSPDANKKGVDFPAPVSFLCSVSVTSCISPPACPGYRCSLYPPSVHPRCPRRSDSHSLCLPSRCGFRPGCVRRHG